jgi:hypothetical protein
MTVTGCAQCRIFSGRRRNGDINLLLMVRAQCRDEFSVPLSRNDNMPGGVIMSLSTFVVLIGLTFGQSVLLTLGLFVLWLAGEIGAAALSEHSIERPRNDSHPTTKTNR